MEAIPQKPRYEDFNIPTEKVLEHNRLQDEYNKLKRSITKGPSYKLYYFIALGVTAISYIHGYDLTLDLVTIIKLLIIAFPVSLPVMFLCQLVGIIQNAIYDNLPFTKEAKLLKKIKELEPIVNRYDSALKAYTENIAQYERKYPGIKEQGYNRELFIKSKKTEIVRILNKKFDYLENIAKIEWWYNLTPLEFEEEVAKWYRRKGYESETTSYVGDGGIDIILNKDGKTICVQCKHYKGSVGVSIMRDLLGTVTAHKADKGILVCLTKPTQGAIDFAHENNIGIVTVHTLAQSTSYSANYSRAIRYNNGEAYIGSMQPYMYIGDIGVLFNIFYDKRETTSYIKSLTSNGLHATSIEVNHLYHVICSTNIKSEDTITSIVR